MKIKKICIEGFRSFDKEEITFEDYTCLVGENGAGKSTVLNALNIFFHQKETSAEIDSVKMKEKDFHLEDTSRPIKITLTFTDIEDKAKEDLKHYVRQDTLIVSAEARFDSNGGPIKIKQYGEREVMEAFSEFFETAKDRTKNVDDLKKIYSKIRDKNPEMDLKPPSTKGNMEKELRDYEESHPEKCILKPSKDDFYGVQRVVNRLENYIQWIYVPTIKDITEEQAEKKDTALEKILQRTVKSKKDDLEKEVQKFREKSEEEYRNIVKSYKNILDEISKSLSHKLQKWAHPKTKADLQWEEDRVKIDETFAKIMLSEGEHKGELSSFGHGLQRSLLLALLEELAQNDDSASPTLILGCEEPELYQHPPQARYLASVLKTLSEGNAQIIATTHSPLFVSGDKLESIRMVRKNDNHSKVSGVSYEDIAKTISDAGDKEKPKGSLAKIHNLLQPALNEMFFTPKLILVEGLEDMAYITTYIELLGKGDDYRKSKWHIVPTNGKSQMIRTLAIAKKFDIETFVIFDADQNKTGNQFKQQKKDNEMLLSLLNNGDEDSEKQKLESGKITWGNNFAIWPISIGETVEGDIGDKWEKSWTQANEKYGNAGNLHKNILCIGETLYLAWENGGRSENLKKLCEKILAYETTSPS